MSLTTEMRQIITEMPVTESVIKQVAKWAKKDCSITGVTFMDKYGVAHKFDNLRNPISVSRNLWLLTIMVTEWFSTP